MPQRDYRGRMALWPYDTRITPIKPPTEGIFDAPTASICLNVKWAAHLDGVLERLMWFDAWDGPQETKEWAVRQVQALLVSLMQRIECGDGMDVRQSPEDCKILEKYSGGEWVTFADFNGCIQDGERGPVGPVGGIGPIGPVGPVGPANGGNNYPPLPTDPDKMCNAANYIVEQVRSLIVGVYSQLSTIEASEVVNSLLGQSGWSVAALIELVGYAAGSLDNQIANLASFDAAKDDMVCRLLIFDLDKEAFVNWIETNYAGQEALQSLVKNAINAANADGRYALWAAVGAMKTGANCEICEEEPEGCELPKPSSIAFLYGSVLNVTDDVYTVQSQLDDNGNYVITWPNQAYLVTRTKQVEFFSLSYTSGESGINRVYAEETIPNSTIINTETDPGTLNFPYCVSYFQIYSKTTQFTAQIGFR